MGTYLEGLSLPRKHRLEEVAWGRTSSSEKGAPKQYILKQGAISRFHNTDPLARLIGEPNETYAVVEGIKTKVLLDSGAQLCSIMRQWVQELGLEIQQLKTILDLEGTGGLEIPYERYVELNLDIPEVKGFKEDVLMLVVKDSEYEKKVPVAIGTLHIDMILDLATKEELENMGRRWQRGSLGRKITIKHNVLSTQDIPFDLGESRGRSKGNQKCCDKTFSHSKIISQE